MNKRSYRKWLLFGPKQVETDAEVIARLTSTYPFLYPSRILSEAYNAIRSMRDLAAISQELTVTLDKDDTKWLLFENDHYHNESLVEAYVKKHNL